jgi:hypothetical protein
MNFEGRGTGSIPVGVKELDCRKNLDFVSRVSKISMNF